MSRRARTHGLTVAACLATGCGIPYGGDNLDPQWDVDGRHIFYVEQRFISGPHPFEYYRLYRALPDRSERQSIASGRICCGMFGSNGVIRNWAAQSPDGRLVLYEEGDSLVVYDIEAEDDVLSVSMDDVSEGGLVHNAGWRPDSAAIYLTDLQGDEVKLLPLDGSPPRTLLRGSRIAAGWSPDGRWLFATSARGGGDGNELYALDVASGEERQVLDVPRGEIGQVVFSADGQQLAFDVSRMGEKGESSTIYAASADGRAVRELWQGESPAIDGLVWSAEPGVLLVYMHAGQGSETMLTCLGPGGVMRPLFATRRDLFDFNWSYHRATNRIIYTDRRRTTFVTADMPPCAGDQQLSEQ